MDSRIKRVLLLHLIIQVSDDLQVQCETYRPTLLFVYKSAIMGSWMATKGCARHVIGENVMRNPYREEET